MDGTTVFVLGLPTTCNPVKIKLLFEAECGVSIESVKFEGEGAEVSLNNKKDAESFRRKLPESIRFGGNSFDLKISEKPFSAKVEEASGDAVKSDEVDPDVTHSWYSLHELPSCQSGILVQANDLEIKDIKEHFENNQLSCGGAVAGMIRMMDGIFIFFKDKETAKKVWDFRPHRIRGKSVAVFLKYVPDRYDEKLYIEGKDNTVDEKQLEAYLTGKSIVPKVIKPYPNNVFCASYDQDVDANEVDAVMKEFPPHLSRKISRLLKTDCLEVGSVSVNVSREEMKILFENETRSGGGRVTRIDRIKGNSMLVYFASYQDAENAYKKFRGKTLPIFDCSLKIRRYFHCFYDLHQNATVSETSGDNPGHLSAENSDWSLTKNSQLQSTGALRNLTTEMEILTLTDSDIRFLYDSDLLGQIQKVYSVTITSKIERKILLISGDKCKEAKSSITEILRANPTSFMAGADDESEELIPMAYGKAKYLAEYCDVFKSLCKDRAVTHTKADEQGLVIRGPARMLKEVADEVRELERLVLRGTEFLPNHIAGGRQGRYVIENCASRFKTVILMDKGRAISTPQDGAKAFIHNPSTVQMGSLVVSVREGDITDKHDTIVSSCLPSFNLSLGGVSKAILEKAGESIQKEVYKKSGKYLRVTSSGKLLCKRIFHVVVPLIESDFQPRLQCILQEAQSRNCKSLSLPAIGAGTFSFSNSMIAREMMKAFYEFARKNPTNPREIKIVISDTSLLPDFKNALSAYGQGGRLEPDRKGWSPQLKPQGGASPVLPTTFIMKFGPLKVSIRQGDITDDKNDAIVNSTSKTFSLSVGMISTAIIKKGGHGIQKEVLEAKGSDIRITSAGKLPSKKIIHVVLPSKQHHIQSFLADVLRTADQNGCKSLSIPAIGTGNRRIPTNEMANLMVKAFKEFAKKYSDAWNLSVVDIVIFDPTQLQEFVRGFSKAEPGVKTEGWRSTLLSFVSEFTGISLGKNKTELTNAEAATGASGRIVKDQNPGQTLVYLYSMDQNSLQDISLIFVTFLH